MPTTVLCIGDPHIQISNIQEVDIFIEKITILAKEKQPDLICILGDQLHTHERLNTIALNKAYQLIQAMRLIAKTYILTGNHDYISNQQFLTTNHWMNALKEWNNVVIVDKVITETINNEKLVFIPYVPTGRFVEALNTLEEGWEDASCIFAHQEFFGCKMGAITSIDGDRWEMTNPYVISGHIHSRQLIQNNVYYPGSAMQNAFGESEKNTIAYIQISDNEYKLEEIDLGLPRKKIVYMDVDDLDTYIPTNTDDKVKITLSGEYEDFKSMKKTKKYKELAATDNVKIVFKTKKIDRKEKADMLNVSIENVVDGVHFGDILNNLVLEKNDNFLYQSYQMVVHGKHIEASNLMFV
jgi:DNA repair exonuclease SbcCD nuclease subunit